MVERQKALMSWSTGKDSAFAYWQVRCTGELDVVGLLTTVTRPFDRVSMHGVRETLLDAQIERIGLPCRKIFIPSPCSNEVYEAEMAAVMASAKQEGVTHIVFGDLYLADLRAYREAKLAAVGMTAVFPLWQPERDTPALAKKMIAQGISARLTCVDPRHLGLDFAGRTYDASLLADLPSEVDPCGERGEFHTFVTEGPMFERPIEVVPGDVVERGGFVFADLLPA